MPQTFRVVHNLDKPAVTVAADVVETFESFARDKQYPGQSACNTGVEQVPAQLLQAVQLGR